MLTVIKDIATNLGAEFISELVESNAQSILEKIKANARAKQILKKIQEEVPFYEALTADLQKLNATSKRPRKDAVAYTDFIFSKMKPIALEDVKDFICCQEGVLPSDIVEFLNVFKGYFMEATYEKLSVGDQAGFHILVSMLAPYFDEVPRKVAEEIVGKHYFSNYEVVTECSNCHAHDIVIRKEGNAQVYYCEKCGNKGNAFVEKLQPNDEYLHLRSAVGYMGTKHSEEHVVILGNQEIMIKQLIGIEEKIKKWEEKEKRRSEGGFGDYPQNKASQTGIRNKGMPWWAVVCIVVALVASIAIAVYFLTRNPFNPDQEQTYSITYDASGGTLGDANYTTTYKKGESIRLPIVTKPYYKLHAWISDGTAIDTSILSNNPRNITLTASWTIIDSYNDSCNLEATVSQWQGGNESARNHVGCAWNAEKMWGISELINQGYRTFSIDVDYTVELHGDPTQIYFTLGTDNGNVSSFTASKKQWNIDGNISMTVLKQEYDKSGDGENGLRTESLFYSGSINQLSGQYLSLYYEAFTLQILDLEDYYNAKGFSFTITFNK